MGAQAIESALILQKGFICADDMGLGKTWQALAPLKFHPELWRFAVVTKSSLKFQWSSEVLRLLGPEFVCQIIETGRDTILPMRGYIIAYDMLRRFPKERLEKMNLKCVILDECQQIKNVDSTRTQEVRKLVKNPTCKVIATSGTPWKNKGAEFFPVLNLVAPMKFPSEQGFFRQWVDVIFDPSNGKTKQGGIKRIPEFKKFTQDILIRREFNEVMDEFPDINRTKMPVKLEEFMQDTYDNATSEFVSWYNEFLINGTEDQIGGIELLAKMSRMRHLTGLAKVAATIGFVEEFIEDTDRKLVIFVHHKDVGEILFTKLTELFGSEIPIMKLTAEYSDVERYDIANKFNKLNRVIMVASTLASGEGINLQSCHDCIMHERQWNPQNEDQAAPGRFRRIGQTSNVINIVFPEAVETIDELFDQIVTRKRKYFHDAMNKGEAPQWNENELLKELANVIVSKHNKKMGGKGSKISKDVLVNWR